MFDSCRDQWVEQTLLAEREDRSEQEKQRELEKQQNNAMLLEAINRGVLF